MSSFCFPFLLDEKPNIFFDDNCVHFLLIPTLFDLTAIKAITDELYRPDVQYFDLSAKTSMMFFYLVYHLYHHPFYSQLFVRR